MQVRYNTRRDFGHPKGELETRNEYHMRFGRPVEPDPVYPAVVSHVLEWFWELSAKRQYGAGGPSPLSFSDLKAWTGLTGTYVDPLEMKMILAMDSAWLSTVAEESRQDRLRHEGMSKLKAQTGKRGFAR